MNEFANKKMATVSLPDVKKWCERNGQLAQRARKPWLDRIPKDKWRWLICPLQRVYPKLYLVAIGTLVGLMIFGFVLLAIESNASWVK